MMTFLALALAAAVELHGTIAIQQTTKTCNGADHTVTWTNGFGLPLYLTGGHIWQGAARGIRADIGARLYIQKGPTDIFQLMRVAMWDHYTDPSGSSDNEITIDLDGHYFVLQSGGQLKLEYGCTLVGLQDGPWLEGLGGQFVPPWEYFLTVQGHLQQAYVRFSLTRPE